MKKAKLFFNSVPAGILTEEKGKYRFEYFENYHGSPVSLTLPTTQKQYRFDKFPPFLDGLLPEGPQLEALLRQAKLDRDNYFDQLVTVGADLVGAITVEELK